MRAQRRALGCVRYDKRRGTWNYLFYDHGKRRSKLIGTKRQYPTKAATWKATEVVRASLKPLTNKGQAPTVRSLVEDYRAEKMPTRYSTRRSYNAWLSNHIIPKFGQCAISDVQARPAELWLESLSLTPRSRAAVRGLLRILWDYAMWSNSVPTQRNPMELVTIKSASKRTSKPRSLTVEEFQRFVQHLGEPFHTISLVCVCFGLRISEALALRWSDLDWLNGTLSVQRGIVRQRVDDVKTETSHKAITVTGTMLAALKDVEANNPVLSTRGLDFRFPGTDRASAVVRRQRQRCVQESRICRWNRARQYAQHEAHVPLMARRCGNSDSRATKAHAARGHSHNHEHLRRCGDR